MSFFRTATTKKIKVKGAASGQVLGTKLVRVRSSTVKTAPKPRRK